MLFGLHHFTDPVLAVVFDGAAAFDDGVGSGGLIALEAGEFAVRVVVPVEGVGTFAVAAVFDFGQGAAGAEEEPFGLDELLDEVFFGVGFGGIGGEPGGFDGFELIQGFTLMFQDQDVVGAAAVLSGLPTRLSRKRGVCRGVFLGCDSLGLEDSQKQIKEC